MAIKEAGEIGVDREDAIAVVTIDHVEKRNAFTGAMTTSLLETLKTLDEDDSVRCIVIRGAGDQAFSSGHDLSELVESWETAADPVANRAFVLPSSMETPVVAAINGYTYAAGLILALSCDIRVASTSAQFAAPGVRIGLLPVGGQLSKLPQLVPPGIALEMLLLGEPFDAQRAYECGFVNHLVETDEVLPTAMCLARVISRNAPGVVSATKRAVHRGLEEGAMVAAAYETQAGGRLLREPDAHEGVAAFLEKRHPEFGGSHV